MKGVFHICCPYTSESICYCDQYVIDDESLKWMKLAPLASEMLEQHRERYFPEYSSSKRDGRKQWSNETVEILYGMIQKTSEKREHQTKKFLKKYKKQINETGKINRSEEAKSDTKVEEENIKNQDENENLTENLSVDKSAMVGEEKSTIGGEEKPWNVGEEKSRERSSGPAMESGAN